MVELYEKGGYPDAKVEPVVTLDRDTGKALLKYKVTEGDRVFIQQIIITGNQAVKSRALLKLIKTKRRWWLSWMAGSGVMKDADFQEDLDKIREHYRSKGYIDMEIKSVKIDRTGREWMTVRLDIFEGQQYKVGTVTLEGNKLFTTADLEKRLKLKTGSTFTPDAYQKDIKALEDYYGARGYLDTRVQDRKSTRLNSSHRT